MFEFEIRRILMFLYNRINQYFKTYISFEIDFVTRQYI